MTCHYLFIYLFIYFNLLFTVRKPRITKLTLSMHFQMTYFFIGTSPPPPPRKKICLFIVNPSEISQSESWRGLLFIYSLSFPTFFI